MSNKSPNLVALHANLTNSAPLQNNSMLILHKLNTNWYASFMLCDYNMYKQFGVGQKWKSWTIEMLFTFCSNNKTLYVILAQQTPKLPVHGVFREDDLDYFLETN